MTHGHGTLTGREEAIDEVLRIRRNAIANRPTEEVPVSSVSDRTLVGSIIAMQDYPSHDRATMDGYAFDAADEYPLRVVGEEVFPESSPPRIAAGEAVRIATGAPLPERADAVLKREEAVVTDGQLTGTNIERGTYVYEQGSNVAAGEQLFDASERLSPKDSILLGDLGMDHIQVVERFSAGILATGTEIHENRTNDLDSAMLAGLIRSWGHEATFAGTVPDEYGQVRNRIEELASDYDVVVTTGGTSVGHKDYVIRALEEIGEVQFHRVRIRPGKPIAVAQLPDAVAFAIPGKPLGAHTIASLIMRPFFSGDATLPTIDATLTTDVSLGSEGFEYAIPVILTDGMAAPLGHNDSPLPVYTEMFDPSVVSSSTRASRADGFVLTREQISEGDSVAVIPYSVVE
ncbi:molybdopterin molybdotransferase MoeA [Halorarum salinum]|uniref:molybdopterin molybdotransferase MoeA n=1 Tax=Halorarum salinum TaxID=2743089 RepID=UPI001FE5E853|nr:molybdopterin molybdotransferase MoeA [Halobaculum salinum]